VRGVVLVGGFGAPSALLRPLARDLASLGHEVVIAPLGLNVDCGERSVERVLSTIDDLGDDVALVGHSRGGQLARVAAVRAPDRVTSLITAGTPWTIGPPAYPGVAITARALRALRGRGIDLLPSIECADGPCCVDFRRDVREKPRARWTALWSSRDRVAGADSAPPALADEQRDTGTSHIGFVRDARGREAIADALSR
jgi:pimeloyl-ACP methyl ester carboxylesterase